MKEKKQTIQPLPYLLPLILETKWKN